ncbi:hypothetical protein [Anaerobiospirillum sp. NML120449]|uniref:hypothetical protein n=1 Tax=Anaerobiospirillum sp. NML120449 TaxID=2932817 RepID=UPI001FF40AFD|nr:hypothetical protein [Anaerobiospirillum sp. NML120449]MCK0527426.1 hypothetical protein [Anaerobiospirillum sp. NML120449]
MSAAMLSVSDVQVHVKARVMQVDSPYYHIRPSLTGSEYPGIAGAYEKGNSDFKSADYKAAAYAAVGVTADRKKTCWARCLFAADAYKADDA